VYQALWSKRSEIGSFNKKLGDEEARRGQASLQWSWLTSWSQDSCIILTSHPHMDASGRDAIGDDTSQLSSLECFAQGAISLPEGPNTSPLTSHWPELCHVANPSCKRSWESQNLAPESRHVWLGPVTVHCCDWWKTKGDVLYKITRGERGSYIQDKKKRKSKRGPRV
jgi:hypothetical protein